MLTNNKKCDTIKSPNKKGEKFMKNYINLNGTKIKLTQEQVAEMQKSFGIKQTKLSSIPVGETFKIGGYEFVVLEQSGDTVAVILKTLLFERKPFGVSNNYKDSNADKLCVTFGKEIEDIVGSKNLIQHTVDLTADDGLKDYGMIQRKMSLLTANFYRRYVKILDKHKISFWWWLCTAYSTPTHTENSWIKCVSPFGSVNSNYYGSEYGVRPFCILNSNIFVSK